MIRLKRFTNIIGLLLFCCFISVLANAQGLSDKAKAHQHFREAKEYYLQARQIYPGSAESCYLISEKLSFSMQELESTLYYSDSVFTYNQVKERNLLKRKVEEYTGYIETLQKAYEAEESAKLYYGGKDYDNAIYEWEKAVDYYEDLLDSDWLRLLSRQKQEAQENQIKRKIQRIENFIQNAEDYPTKKTIRIYNYERKGTED